MINIELYINGHLCDTPPGFAPRLNRQLINPGELSTKDAQFSFSVSLPETATNNAAFGYTNIEETRNKFNRLYTAQLVVNSVRIFTGAFRLAEINKGYKGNLYLPAQKSVKDIFGGLTLNALSEWRIDFGDFAQSVTDYNQAAAVAPQAAIFPYVLYGLLPKVPLDKNANSYSARDLWDSSVRFGMMDLPPAINPVLLLRHIFASKGYQLTGTALDDERLTRLYMSYKNPAEYVQPWNYGHHATIRLTGGWSSTKNKKAADAYQLERGVNQSSDDTGPIYSTDLLDAVNSAVTITEDSGANVLLKTLNDEDNIPWTNGQIRIPTAGYYKVKFGASVKVNDTENFRAIDPETGVQHIGGYTENATNNLANNTYEVRLMRDRKTADFGLSGAKLDGTFYYENQPQNETYDGENQPKYVPQVGANGQINLVDAAQDSKIVLGFQFGRNFDGGNPNRYVNPKDTTNKWAQVLAAKPALSWDTAFNDGPPVRLAINNPGYWKYGRLGAFDSEGDNPNTNIDYSGGSKLVGYTLSASGNPVAPGAGGGGIVGTRVNFYIDAETGAQTFNDEWEAAYFVDLRKFTDVRFSAEAGVNPYAAVTAFYDEDKLFIGVGFYAPAETGTDTYADEPIAAPVGAVFARVSGLLGTVEVTGTAATSDNVVLNRFPLSRWFTYLFTAPALSGYTGNAYLFNGLAATVPVAIVPFVGGVAQVDTSYSELTTFEPYVTFYLKTADYDVDGTLTISRQIVEGSEDVIDWELTSRYHIQLDNAPVTYAKRGQYQGAAVSSDWNGQGYAAAVVWLEAGELLTIASVTSEGRYRRDGMHSTYGWVNHEVAFSLDVEPFKVNPDWLKVDLAGRGTAAMDWNDAPDFDIDSINLIGFLSSGMKADDFIDNFCKAFNLRLSQSGPTTFALDVKQSKRAVSSQYVNLDGVASVRDKANTSLGLPSLYRLGFTVDVEEEGYVRTGQDGGGQYATGTVEENEIEQKTSFSYCWYKNITKGGVALPLPVISKNEVWLPGSYPAQMAKRYTDQAYRFFYFDGLLNALGATFDFNGVDLQLAKVSNTLAGVSELSYENKRLTILDNYFTILINGSSHYTEVEGYITPIQYAQLNGSVMAMFNGDLYFIAELGGYDPTGRNKTKLKLIRKI